MRHFDTFTQVRSLGDRSSTKPYYLRSDSVEVETEPRFPGIGVSCPTRLNLSIGGRRFMKSPIAGSDRRSLCSVFTNLITGVVQLSGLREYATYVVSNFLGQEVATGTAVNPRIDLSRTTAGFCTATIRKDRPDPVTTRVVKR